MSIETRKISFVRQFLGINDEKVIDALENILLKSKSKLYEKNLKPMSREEFNREIDKAIDDEANNRLTKAEDLKRKIKVWH